MIDLSEVCLHLGHSGRICEASDHPRSTGKSGAKRFKFCECIAVPWWLQDFATIWPLETPIFHTRSKFGGARRNSPEVTKNRQNRSWKSEFSVFGSVRDFRVVGSPWNFVGMEYSCVESILRVWGDSDNSTLFFCENLRLKTSENLFKKWWERAKSNFFTW